VANRAFLLANRSGDPDEFFDPDPDNEDSEVAVTYRKAILAGASYCYPLLWLSLFSQNDLVLCRGVWEEDDGSTAIHQTPCLLTPTALAYTRSFARLPLFFSYLPRSVSRSISSG
jgi:hypothetical protein